MKNRIAVLIIILVAMACSTAIASCTKDDVIDSTGNETRELTNEELATQLMQNATVVSSYDYIFAFPISKMLIIDNKAYINYGANKIKLDGDLINNDNDSCCSIINLENQNITTLKTKTLSKMFSNGTKAPTNTVVGYDIRTVTKEKKMASFALMRFNNNNPFYCYAFLNPDEQEYNYTTCQLRYTDKNNEKHNVDYTINNFRKMIVDLGYYENYIASTKDAYNNINLQYDKESDLYYAFVTTNNEKTNLPFILMQSNDMATWSPVTSLGNSHGAGEIATIIKEGVAYISYRTFSNGTKWLIYNLEDNNITSEGSFNECKNVQSKPDTFTFRNDVYMAVNVYPSVYGNQFNYDPYTVRQEINIYKIVNNKPEFFRKVYNPDGINYFSFCESQNGRIYIAFSEDRRHLYKRLFSNVSFVDVTVLF